MSYEIVKSIKIDETQGKVFINCASNNVYPRIYDISESKYFANILKEKGLKECEIYILKEYEEGNFQAGAQNKYTRALKILYNVFSEEYKSFNWRVWGLTDEQQKSLNNLRNSQQFKALLLKALNTKIPKTKYIIYRLNSNGIKDYVIKTTKRKIYFTYSKKNAKVYTYKGDVAFLERQGYLMEDLNEEADLERESERALNERIIK